MINFLNRMKSFYIISNFYTNFYDLGNYLNNISKIFETLKNELKCLQ